MIANIYFSKKNIQSGWKAGDVIAPMTDLALGITPLSLGIIAILGLLPLGAVAQWSLLGTGAVYSLLTYTTALPGLILKLKREKKQLETKNHEISDAKKELGNVKQELTNAEQKINSIEEEKRSIEEEKKRNFRQFYSKQLNDFLDNEKLRAKAKESDEKLLNKEMEVQFLKLNLENVKNELKQTTTNNPPAPGYKDATKFEKKQLKKIVEKGIESQMEIEKKLDQLEGQLETNRDQQKHKVAANTFFTFSVAFVVLAAVNSVINGTLNSSSKRLFTV